MVSIRWHLGDLKGSWGVLGIRPQKPEQILSLMVFEPQVLKTKVSGFSGKGTLVGAVIVSQHRSQRPS